MCAKKFLTAVEKSEKNLIRLQAVLDALAGFPTPKARAFFLRDEIFAETPVLKRYVEYAFLNEYPDLSNPQGKLSSTDKRLIAEPLSIVLNALAEDDVVNPATFWRKYMKQFSIEAQVVANAIVDHTLGNGLITRKMIKRLFDPVAEPVFPQHMVEPQKVKKAERSKGTGLELESYLSQGQVLHCDLIFDGMKCGTVCLVEYMQLRLVLKAFRDAGIPVKDREFRHA